MDVYNCELNSSCYVCDIADMEDKVQNVLKLIEEDGDSFAKRAEMYYKKRPELVYFVEESYRAYRALAERYDHISTELQNANNTIATLCPDQIQLMEEDDEYSPKPRNFPQVPVANASNVPKVPKAPLRDWKGLITASKQMNKVKNLEKARKSDKEVPKSGLTKAEAFEEIDKLQKDILALQTVKEFVKSSYESGLSKYWGIENQITEMQERICCLEDEFGSGKVIEDDEARRLMAEAAIKSCQETLAQLQEKQEKANQGATEGHKKIEIARQKLKSIRREFLHDQTDEQVESAGAANKEPDHEMKEKIKEHFEVGPLASLTVTELAEKIDELVNKVINLETSVSSQTVLIDRLKTEADDLHNQIRILEEDKANMIDNAKDLSSRLKKLEEKLQGIQELDRNVEKQNSNMRTHFEQARSNLDNLSEKLNSVKPDEEPEVTTSSLKKEPEVSTSSLKEEPEVTTSSLKDEDRTNAVAKDIEKKEDVEKKEKLNNENGKGEANTSGRIDVKDTKELDSGTSDNNQGEDVKQAGKKTVTFQDPISKDLLAQKNQKSTGDDALVKTDSQAETETEDDFNWQQMLLTGLEDKEKILLSEYTTILRNYKETKKRLSDIEKRDKDQDFEVALQISDMRSAIAKRDEEIQRLRQKLGEDVPASTTDRGVKAEDIDNHLSKKEDAEIKFQPHVYSQAEEKLRMDIDAILDENLEFWLKFSTSFHQIQKFKNTVHDLQNEISKIKEKKQQQEGGSVVDLRSEVRPIYKHLKEIQAELTVWLEQSVLLKNELESRFTSLCNIQEKITVALKEGVEEEEIRFSSHQAAKFQGEVLNMKQENTKVKNELQAGVDHVTTLQGDIDKTLKNLTEEFELAGDQPQLRHSASRSRVPLRSFIFGTKPKKQKHSIFSCVHPNKKYQVLRAGYLFRSLAHESISN